MKLVMTVFRRLGPGPPSAMPTGPAASIGRVTQTTERTATDQSETVGVDGLEDGSTTAVEIVGAPADDRVGAGVSPRVTVIRPARRRPHLDVPELWHYRELLGTLVWRDVLVRYKQTFIGVAWALLVPF